MPSPALPVPYLRVNLAGGIVLTFPNLRPWTCVRIDTCSYWHRTASVSWGNLNRNQYGAFYETTNCDPMYSYEYFGDMGGTGNHTFKTHESFTSVILAELYAERPLEFVDNCPNDRENAVLNETRVYVTSAGEDGSSTDGGLSSNWKDSLAWKRH
ncbi:hypothetical protein DVH05_017497 [Phytophthora capsici]|nr:hypothetical protein DVH05_017497 [Phytophthora capsici]